MAADPTERNPSVMAGRHSADVERPVFFIGMPRSGTTIVFEAFVRHPAVAFPLNYSQRCPRIPQLGILRRALDRRAVQLIGHKRQYGHARLGNRFLPSPSEAYAFWNCHGRPEFGRSYLDEALVGSEETVRLRGAVRELMRWQGRARFCAKLTGPPRIAYLSRIFRDSIFVHVIRDGRAVVHSLLKVGFWRAKGGYDAPFWQGRIGLPGLEQWKVDGRDPGALAALQWRHIVGLAREEGRGLGAGRYYELKYEDFVLEPVRTLATVMSNCELPMHQSVIEHLRRVPPVGNLNSKYVTEMSTDYLDMLVRHLQPELATCGYV